ncbi:DUF6093 family protein [Curtobacterium sp. MCLR17_032]|uniref:DUF6093 family protein n=1 Tax=Curtobacterium sp. MCLR17_032 TaxID=2175650 RepID=UPI0032E88CEC
MTAESAARSGRWIAESIMTDTCRVGKEVPGPINEATGKRETVIQPVYEGACRFKASAVQAADAEQAGQLLVSQAATLSLPLGTSGAVTKGHVVEITGSLTDASLVGRRARVDAPFASSYATARRFPITLLT